MTKEYHCFECWNGIVANSGDEMSPLRRVCQLNVLFHAGDAYAFGLARRFSATSQELYKRTMPNGAPDMYKRVDRS